METSWQTVHGSAESDKQLSSISRAFALSILLHLLLLSYLSLDTQETSQPPIRVRLEEIEQKREQIVAPVEKNTETNIEAKKLSSNDSKVKTETLRRGLEGGETSPSVTTSQKQSNSSSQASKSSTTETAPKRKENSEPILFSQSALLKANSNPNGETASGEQTKSKKQEDALDSHQPFSQNSLFRSQPGSADYLPSIPDGDITLLNTKAQRFAVFVHRVAHQVFGALRQESWQSLNAQQISALRNYAIVYATMSKEGKLLSLRIATSSGVSEFDEVLHRAVKKGAWDQNPPAEAVASDGNIQFVFKAKTWARFVGEGRTQQRWILLGTGLR